MLPLAIGSVLGQTLHDYEVLIVDDGSTDATRQVVAGYLARGGSRVKYLFKENGGCASARNLGLKEAQGQYIAFLDSDDWLLPRKLEEQVACLEFSSADVAFGPWYDYYVDMERYMGPICPVAYDNPNEFGQLHFQDTRFPLSCALIRRHLVDLAVGPFDESMRWNEDSDFVQRLAMTGRRWAPASYPSFVRRVHPGGKSQNRVRIYQHLLESALRLGQAYPEFKAAIGDTYDRRVAQLYGLLARAELRQGCASALDSLAEAIRLLPHLSAEISSDNRDIRIMAALLGRQQSGWRQLLPDGMRRFWRRQVRPALRRVGRKRGANAKLPEQVPGAPPVARS